MQTDMADINWSGLRRRRRKKKDLYHFTFLLFPEIRGVLVYLIRLTGTLITVAYIENCEGVYTDMQNLTTFYSIQSAKGLNHQRL